LNLTHPVLNSRISLLELVKFNLEFARYCFESGRLKIDPDGMQNSIWQTADAIREISHIRRKIQVAISEDQDSSGFRLVISDHGFHRISKPQSDHL
jgi:hypothetical protein